MQHIVDLLAALPPRRDQILPALHLVQNELGYVPREAMRLIARRLGLSEAQVYGPATFYSEFRLSPPPRTLVTWCGGPACRILGGLRLGEALQAELGCRFGENDPEDRWGLWLGQCNGTCEHAPQVWINGRVMGPLSVTEAVRLARRIKAGETVAPPPPGAVETAPARFHREPSEPPRDE